MLFPAFGGAMEGNEFGKHYSTPKAVQFTFKSQSYKTFYV
jgi:hypothetical protein